MYDVVVLAENYQFDPNKVYKVICLKATIKRIQEELLKYNFMWFDGSTVIRDVDKLFLVPGRANNCILLSPNYYGEKTPVPLLWVGEEKGFFKEVSPEPENPCAEVILTDNRSEKERMMDFFKTPTHEWLGKGK